MNTVTQARAECVARKLARRRTPEYREIPGPGGAVFRVQLEKPEFRGPESLGDWLDDQLIGTPARGRAGEVLHAVAAAARDGGAAAAAAAVRQAQALTGWEQWWMYQALRHWGGRAHVLIAAQSLVRAVLREWELLGLAAAAPENEPFPVRTVNGAELAASEARQRSRRPAVSWPRPACLDLQGWAT